MAYTLADRWQSAPEENEHYDGEYGAAEVNAGYAAAHGLVGGCGQPEASDVEPWRHGYQAYGAQ